MIITQTFGSYTGKDLHIDLKLGSHTRKDLRTSMAATPVASVCVSAVRRQNVAGEECIDINVTPKDGARVMYVSMKKPAGGRLQIRVAAARFHFLGFAGRWQHGDGSEEIEEGGDESPTTPRTSSLFTPSGTEAESEAGDTIGSEAEGARAVLRVLSAVNARDDLERQAEKAAVGARDAPQTFTPMTPPVNITNRHKQEKQLTIVLVIIIILLVRLQKTIN